MHRGIILSRRDLFRRSARMATCALGWSRGQGGSVEKPGTSYGELAMRLVKNIDAELHDVSPDSKKLCLYFGNPVRSFTRRKDRWEEKNSQVREGEPALRVVHMDSWKSIYSTRVPAIPYFGSFFADSEALYASIPGVGGGRCLHVVVELHNGAKLERIEEFNPDGWSFSYRALGDRMLLGEGARRNPREEVLIKAELPSFKEIQRVPYAERVPGSKMWGTDIRTAADRRTFVYSFDDTVVVRRSEDLEALWQCRVGTDRGLSLTTSGISADGKLVAVGASHWEEKFEKYYVVVYEGRKGEELARFPVDGDEVTRLPVDSIDRVAISPDGKLLAVGQRLHLDGEPSGTQPTVHVFDIATRKKVATLIQDQLRQGGARQESLISSFSCIQFTPDGKYLVTSTINTKVWEMGRY
jgi:hypothetical protein